MVDRLLFRSLPYPESERLVSVGMQFILMTDGAFMVANDYLHLREAETGFQSLTSWRGVSDCDLTEENPRRMSCAEVERTFLGTFGIRPLLGRDFTARRIGRTARRSRFSPTGSGNRDSRAAWTRWGRKSLSTTCPRKSWRAATRL